MTDHPLRGIALMIAFCALAPLADSVAKLIGAAVPLIEILLVRFAVQAALLWPLARRTGGSSVQVVRRLPRPVLAMLALRTLLQIVGIGLMFLALRWLPLADAVAIAFVTPFILLLLGRLLLGEEVGTRRLVACAIGFAGTLLVVQPSFAEVGAPALLPLGVAVVFALYMLASRRIAKADDPVVLQWLSGLMALPLLAAALAVGAALGWPEFVPVWPDGREVALLLGLGVLGTAAHLAMTWSVRYAPAATLAPIQYVEIPFATLIGWLVFGDLPNGLAAVGIGITVAAGLLVLHHERRAALAARAARAARAPVPQA